MTGMKLATFLLLILVLELMLFSDTVVLWRRRRRRRYIPPPPSCDSQKPHSQTPWVNNWRGRFDYECPFGKSLTQWYSYYRNCQKDRLYRFSCGLGPVKFNEKDCHWTPHPENDEKGNLHYSCHDGFITGVESKFSTASTDRRFGFKCCKVHGYKQRHCKSTPHMNSFGETLDYKVKPRFWLTGVISEYSTSFSDRRWKFYYCQIVKDYGSRGKK